MLTLILTLIYIDFIKELAPRSGLIQFLIFIPYNYLENLHSWLIAKLKAVIFYIGHQNF